MPLSQLTVKAKTYIDAWRRILMLSRKPDEEEFNLLLRLNALGFLLVGSIGYLIHLAYVLISGG
jgi:protein transport protein SEC61 subunit gamma-like protein